MTEEVVGENSFTLSSTRSICDGIKDASGRRKDALSFRPAPTRVLFSVPVTN